MATGVMELATTAALIVDEHTWATPFVAATLDAGGLLVASQRILVQDVMDALDVLEDLS